jgi:hypothetical protein
MSNVKAQMPNQILMSNDKKEAVAPAERFLNNLATLSFRMKREI